MSAPPRPVAPPQSEGPKFKVSEVQYKPPMNINNVITANNILLIQMRNRLIRLDLNDPDELYDIPCSKDPTAFISNVFVDPTGTHVIICIDTEVLYLHKWWTKPKPLKEFRGQTVVAMGWDEEALVSGEKDRFDTVRLLAATNTGQVFDAELTKAEFEEPNTLLDLKWRDCYSFDEGTILKDLNFYRFPKSNQIYLIVTTASRLYQFVGPVDAETFADVFAANTKDGDPTFREIPGNLSHFRFHPGQLHSSDRPSYFAWLNSAGILHGPLKFGKQAPVDETVMAGAHLLPFDKSQKLVSGDSLQAVNFTMTEHHFIIFFHDRVQAISRLTSSGQNSVPDVAWTHVFPGYPIDGIAYDQYTGILFPFSRKKVYEVSVDDEKSYLWRKLLDLKRYDEALEYTSNPHQMQLIHKQQSNYFFRRGEYTKAASLWGSLPKPFEESVIQLLHLGPKNSEALFAYLNTKLGTLRYQDATQKTVLATWLLELHIHKLNVITALGTMRTEDQKKQQLAVVTSEIQQFLKANKNNLNQHTTFSLLAASGNTSLLLIYSALIKDYDRLLQHFVQEGMWSKSLTIFSQHPDPTAIYKYAPILMYNAPKETVELFIKVNDQLEVSRLLPSLMRMNPANPEAKQHLLSYLKFLVGKGNKDQSIHNFYVSLLAALPKESALLNYFGPPPSHSKRSRKYYYSLDFALQVCTKHDKKRACVVIYTYLELYSEAMGQALLLDLKLAKLVADAPKDEEIRKSLWLIIVQHTVEEKKDIKGAMHCLTQCPLLTIEDIIRYLPDNSTIEEFSEEICLSLEESNKKVEELKKQMVSAERSSHIIREDLKKLKLQRGKVSDHRLCDLTHLPIQGRMFYLYPDGSCFLISALAEEVSQFLTVPEKEHVALLLRRLESGVQGEELEKVQTDLDALIALQHPFYSSRFISSISKPFEAAEEEVESWAL